MTKSENPFVILKYHITTLEKINPYTDKKSTIHIVHSKNRTTCSGLLKTALNNVLLPTLFNVVNNIVQHCCA